MSNNKKNYTYQSFLMSQLQFSLDANPEKYDEIRQNGRLGRIPQLLISVVKDLIIDSCETRTNIIN